MKISDLLLLSTRAFSARPMRTFLTILGVSVGIGTVLFLVSLGYGLQRVVLNKITTADTLLSLDVSPGSSGLISLDKSSLEKIKEIKEVTEMSPVINLNAQISFGELTGDSLVYGVDSSFFRLNGVKTIEGDLFDDSEEAPILLSTAAVKLFNIELKNILKKEIYLNLFLNEGEQGAGDKDGVAAKSVKRDTKYVVKGIVDDDNASFVYIPEKTIRDLNINSYSQVKVKIISDTKMEEVRGRIIDMGFIASSLSDTINQANKIFRIIQIILSLFGLIALIVSSIGMFNTMTVTLLERINEIGIMRSIGASSGDIRSMFLVESLLMGFLGGIGGIAIGYLSSAIVNFGINLLAKNFGGQALDLFYQPTWFIGFIIVFSTIIGLLTGVYPSHRASSLNPLDALRYK